MFQSDDWLIPSQFRSLFANFDWKNCTASNQITAISAIKDVDLQQAVEDIEALQYHSNLLQLAQHVTSEIKWYGSV